MLMRWDALTSVRSATLVVTAGALALAFLVPSGAAADNESVGKLGKHSNLAAITEADGGEPWRSDGTSAGTKLVKDIWQGTDSSCALDC